MAVMYEPPKRLCIPMRVSISGGTAEKFASVAPPIAPKMASAAPGSAPSATRATQSNGRRGHLLVISAVYWLKPTVAPFPASG